MKLLRFLQSETSQSFVESTEFGLMGTPVLFQLDFQVQDGLKKVVPNITQRCSIDWFCLHFAKAYCLSNSFALCIITCGG
jgi:hypothetical protein